MASVDEAGPAAEVQQFIRFLHGSSDRANWMPALELGFDLDQRLVGSIKTPRQEQGDIEYGGGIIVEQVCRIRDVKFRELKCADVRRVGALQQHGQLAKYHAGF